MRGESGERMASLLQRVKYCPLRCIKLDKCKTPEASEEFPVKREDGD